MTEQPSLFRRVLEGYRAYFYHNTIRDPVLYLIAVIILLCYASVCIFAKLIVSDHHCVGDGLKWGNPQYTGSNCTLTRHVKLLGLNLQECDFGVRFLVAMTLGLLLGYERLSPDRAAIIRTTSVTCVGACAFTIGSMFSFMDGATDWDSSRVAAAIPSGVGFLGASLIYKHNAGDLQIVHGLTTGATLWVSAAVGVLCGGALYFAAIFVVLLSTVVLRFGPRSASPDDHHLQLGLHRSMTGPFGHSETPKRSSELVPLLPSGPAH